MSRFLAGGRQAARLRRMYPAGRAGATALRYAHLWVRIIRTGLLPRRWVVLEVPGRRSGRHIRIPLGMAKVRGRWFLVSMLGECNWVRNVRAAAGRATLLRRRATEVRLTEVPPEDREPILREYLRHVPGGRPHFPVDDRGTVEQLAAVAAAHPVFAVARVRPADS